MHENYAYTVLFAAKEKYPASAEALTGYFFENFANGHIPTCSMNAQDRIGWPSSS